jgi:transposase
MPKSRPPYPSEFRQRIIELLRKGRTPESLAEQFEPTAQTIRNWLAQADRDAGQRPDGLTTDEREELRRLRRENKTLREEREILKNCRARWGPSHLLDQKLRVRAAGPPPLPDPGRGPDGRLRLHRGLVQPAPAALRPGL